MRLIDADALREEVEFHPTSVSVCMTVAEAKGQTYFKNRCLEDIDNAPTIDAIPVEWLEHMMTATTLTRTSNAIKHVLALWKRMGPKEQEAR